MSDVFDPRQVRRAFSRASTSYASAARLQREIEARLLESLDYYAQGRPESAQTPTVVVDLGSGPGGASRALRARWPKARVLSLDHALPMLRAQIGAPAGAFGALRKRFTRAPDRICADARALPLADDCVDLLFSNLCLQWIEDLPAVFAGFRRVLKPGGMIVVSTFGPETLHELREAFAVADAVPHVSPFASIAQFGDALIGSGFRNPVLDRDELVTRYDDLSALMRELRAIGATNALRARRHTLTGRGRFAAAAQAYERWREPCGDGVSAALPATWEVITAIAWAPEHGVPIREGDRDVARFPANAIQLRKR
ncbi:MAG: malonyl-ACP O-methyltransferase BioC [Lysobacteraceae bacterium]|nr:MAG: malonyl-ACP O-methyltransferase BioC [Xanthomonadaceae bacterium]